MTEASAERGRLKARVQAFVKSRRGLYVTAALAQLALAPFLIHDWDGFVFTHTVRSFLTGETPYQTVMLGPSHIYPGFAVPFQNSWYAYPPLPLLLMTPVFFVLTLFSGAPWVERLAIKVPFIAGNLLLAYVAAELVRVLTRDEATAARRARIVEVAILFNPFLIFIAAVWGMFDAWVMALLVGAILLAVRGRFAWTGVAFAAACLVKPFPMFVGPLMLGYVWHRAGERAAARFLAAGAVTVVAVCLPFFIGAPQGLLQQAFLNHVQRPPQGLSLANFPLLYPWLNGVFGLQLDAAAASRWVGRASLFVMVGVLALVNARALKPLDDRALVHAMLVGIVATLIVSKVVNEQYFVMPAALATLAYGVAPRRLYAALAIAFSAGGLVASLFIGWHVFTFIPPDVAAALGVNVDAMVAGLKIFLGWNTANAGDYPFLVAAVAMVPAFMVSMRLVGPELLAPVGAVLQRVRSKRPHPATAAMFLAVLLVAPASVAVWTAPSAQGLEPTTALPEPRDPVVGAFYYLWWNNPAHDRDVYFGNWMRGVTQVPADGYYTVTAKKLADDFAAMRAHDIDVAVYSHHEYERHKLPALYTVAYQEGMLAAPLIELGDILNDPAHRPLGAEGSARNPQEGLAMRDATRDAIVEFAASALDIHADAPAAWRRDGKPVIVFYDTYFVAPDASGPVRERLTDEALRVAAARGLSVTRDELAAAYPLDQAALRGNGTYAGVYREAFLAQFNAFWADVRDRLEASYGPLFIMGGDVWNLEAPFDRGVGVGVAALDTFDSSFIYSPSFTWVYHKKASFADNYARWQDNQGAKDAFDRGAGRPVVRAVAPGYDDRVLRAEGFAIPYDVDGQSTYKRLWADATAAGADIVLIATWNEFYEGSSIEPTREQGNRFLTETPGVVRGLRDGQATSTGTLVVTDFLDQAASDRTASEDRAWNHSIDLLRAVGREAGAVVAAERADVARPDFGLQRYHTIAVAGGEALDPALGSRLAAFAADGGRVLVFGGPAAAVDAAVRDAWAAPIEAGAVVRAGDLAVALPPEALAHRASVPANATVTAWLQAAGTRSPAVWHVPFGSGAIIGSAFVPQREAFGSDLDQRAVRILLTLST